MDSFGARPVTPPPAVAAEVVEVELAQAVAILAARILANLKISERRAREAMRAVCAVILSGERGRFVCFSVPWTVALVVTDAEGRAFPRAAAKRHGAEPVALDVDGLIALARAIATKAVIGGGEVKAA